MSCVPLPCPQATGSSRCPLDTAAPDAVLRTQLQSLAMPVGLFRILEQHGVGSVSQLKGMDASQLKAMGLNMGLRNRILKWGRK